MDSTLRSNISVGLPLDLLVYDTGALRVTHFASIDEHNEYFRMIRGTWGERLRQVFAEIPDPLWTNPESPDSWCPPAACTSPSGSTPWTCRRKATRRRRCWPRAGVGSVELETAHVRLYAIPGCPTLRPTHVNFTCPPSEARMQAIAAGFRVSGANAGRPAEPGRLRSAMKKACAGFLHVSLAERSTRQLAPDRHRRLGVVERIECTPGAPLSSRVWHSSVTTSTPKADRGLVVAELGQAQTDPARHFGAAHFRSAAAASGW